MISDDYFNAECKMQNAKLWCAFGTNLYFRNFSVRVKTFCILHFAFLLFLRSALLDFHKRFQQRLQVFFAVEFQLEAAFALAVDDFHASAQVL